MTMADSPIITPRHLPADLRPVQQTEAISSHAKLIAAEAALSIIVSVIKQTHGVTGKRWSQRDRLRYIQEVCEKALHRIK